MTTAKTKGSGFLKVTGILMIIGGGISIILGIIAALGVAALAYISDGEISSAMLYASVALMIVSAVAQLIAGIIGVKNCKKPEKAGTCMVWGVIVAVLCVVGTILNSVVYLFFTSSALDSTKKSTLHDHPYPEKGLFRQAFFQNKPKFNEEKTKWISVEFGK